MLLSAPINVDRLRLAGPPHTTGAGRFALPVAIMDGQHELAVIDLVLDGESAERLHAALDAHLTGRGALTVRRGRAELS